MFKSWLIFFQWEQSKADSAARVRAVRHGPSCHDRSNNGQRASSWPKAIGRLGVDHEYRDGAQSTSVVRRNQLWNTFSVVFVLHAGARVDVSVSRPVVSSFRSAIRHASLAGMSTSS
jgi:hypothetical protein